MPLRALVLVSLQVLYLKELEHSRLFVLQEVQDLYGGVIKMLDSGDKIKVDQTHLETVIPAIGKVMVS